MAKAMKILNWFFSILFLLTGLAALSEVIVPGMAMILAALILLPPVTSLIRNRLKLKFSWWMKAIALLLCLIIFGGTLPAQEAELGGAAIEAGGVVVSKQEKEDTEETVPASPEKTEKIEESKDNTPEEIEEETTESEKDKGKEQESDSSEKRSEKQTDQTGSGKLEVHFIDVGQADSILIKNGSKAMLIDAGNNADASLVVNYIKGQGFTKLDYVIGTHPHEDHIGGLDAVIKGFDIKTLIMPKVSSTTRTFQDVLAAIQEKGMKVTRPVPGKKYELGDAAFTILAPNSSSYSDLNNASVVVRLTHGQNSFLFQGDAEDVSEGEILKEGFHIQSDVLKVGHHGSKYSTGSAYLAKVKPKYAVISVGKGNTYGHPSQEVLDKLAAAGVKVYRTDEQGTIIAVSDGSEISFNKKASSLKAKAAPTSTAKPKVQKSSKPTSSPKTTASPSPTPKKTVEPAPKQEVKPTPKKEVKPAPTEEGNESTVYITKTGSKYHRDGCRHLSKSKIPISLSEAKSKGYSPCGVCY
jgi:competence protein ComEC